MDRWRRRISHSWRQRAREKKPIEGPDNKNTHEFRTRSDDSGQHTIEANFSSSLQGKVTLKKKYQRCKFIYFSTGTGTEETTSETKDSGFRPRNCARGEIINRWGRTDGAIALISSGIT